MTVLSVVKDVCATVGVEIPQSLFSGIAANRTAEEMLALANEMAQRIGWDSRDWTKLKKTATFTGDGYWSPPQPDPLAVWTGTLAFDLPADYKRMLLSANVWRSTSALQPMQFVPDADEWLQRRALNRYNAWGEWTMIGGQMLIWPIMAGFIPAVPAVSEDPGPPYVPAQPARPAVPAVTATFIYLDKNCVALASGGFGDSFLADGDSFALDERILKLGMIWQWKAQKGSPYAEDLATFNDALDRVSGADKPAPILIDRGPISAATRIGVAYPWPVPT